MRIRSRRITVEKKRTLIKVASVAAVLVIALICFFVSRYQKQTVSKEQYTVATEFETAMSESYIEITNATELMAMSNDLDGNYILMNDIDLTGIDWQIIGTSSSSPFTGTFDGNYYTISNLNIESANQYTGMFGYVEDGIIKNLNLQNVTIQSTYTHTNIGTTSTYASSVGSVAGYITGGIIDNISILEISRIENVKSENSVYIGGIAGRISQGKLTNINNNASVVGKSKSGAVYAGGIAGYVNSSIISNIISKGNVTGIIKNESNVHIGGIVGETVETTITESYATGNVEIIKDIQQTYDEVSSENLNSEIKEDIYNADETILNNISSSEGLKASTLVDIRIRKRDDENRDIVIPGVKIGIYTESGTKIREGTTGKNGMVIFYNMAPR